MIRRHNVAVYVVHELETEADCASRLEVTGLYPGQKRVDTHDIVANTSEAMASHRCSHRLPQHRRLRPR